MPLVDPKILFGDLKWLFIHHSWVIPLPWLFLSDLVSCLLCPLIFIIICWTLSGPEEEIFSRSPGT
jgi:hypothetical protein